MSLLNLTDKLQIDKPMDNRPHVTARSIARKIKDESKRSTMLKLLQIDRTKHDMSRINNAMKDDLEITVKEAVIANNIAMFESALLLGNLGIKMMKVSLNTLLITNFLILGSACDGRHLIPDLTVISDYKGMNKRRRGFHIEEQGIISACSLQETKRLLELGLL